MDNAEFFKNYGTEKWAVEENLSYMLLEFWDAAREHPGGKNLPLKPPVNPVSFIKAFMKEESLVDIENAEQSKMKTLEKNEAGIIEAEYEVIEAKAGDGFDLSDLAEKPEGRLEKLGEGRENVSTTKATGALDFENLVWPGE